MPTAQQALSELERSEADIRQARAILACLADASLCPPEWVDEFDRLRRGHYTSTVSTYDQVRTQLGQEPGGADKLARFDSMVPFPLPVPGLPPRARAKVEAKRRKGSSESSPDYADLLLWEMGLPPTVNQRLGPWVELPPEAEKYLEGGYDGARIVAGYKDFGIGAGIAVGLSFVAGVILYRLLENDPGSRQMEIQTRQYRDYLGVVGPVLTQVATGMREGTITTEQATEMIGRLQTLCPDAALPDIPGAGVCGIGSCGKWFWPAFFIAAGGIFVLAWSQGYFRRLGPGERATMLPSPRRPWFAPRPEKPRAQEPTSDEEAWRRLLMEGEG